MHLTSNYVKDTEVLSVKMVHYNSSLYGIRHSGVANNVIVSSAFLDDVRVNICLQLTVMVWYSVPVTLK
jgi:hypothetical protein